MNLDRNELQLSYLCPTSPAHSLPTLASIVLPSRRGVDHLPGSAWSSIHMQSQTTYQLHIIPQRIQHKGPVVVLMVLRTESRGPIAGPASRDGGLVESINGSAV